MYTTSKFLIKRLFSENAKSFEQNHGMFQEKESDRAMRQVEKEKTARNYAMLHCFL